MEDYIDYSGQSVENVIDIYVDGSYKNGIYSYAFIIVNLNKDIIYKESGVERNKYSSKMHSTAGEIVAVIKAINYCIKKNYKAIIHFDYDGIAAIFNNECKINKELFKNYKDFMMKNKDIVYGLVKVKSHNNNYFNDYVHNMAAEAFNLIDK